MQCDGAAYPRVVGRQFPPPFFGAIMPLVVNRLDQRDAIARWRGRQGRERL